jgi:hypothetical protein
MCKEGSALISKGHYLQRTFRSLTNEQYGGNLYRTTTAKRLRTGYHHRGSSSWLAPGAGHGLRRNKEGTGDAGCIQAQNSLQHKGCMQRRIDRRVGAYEEQFQPFIWKPRQGDLLALLPEEQESGPARCGHLLTTHRSMNERRAVVSSQASGFCGTPSRGQVVSAATNALLSASSALATSRVWGKGRPPGDRMTRGLGARSSDECPPAPLRSSHDPPQGFRCKGADAAGQRTAQSSAASSEGSSKTIKPASCSLVSAKGPSCTRRFPSLSRTVVPVSGTSSGWPAT